MRLRCWSIKYGFGEKSEEVEELLKTVSEAINVITSPPPTQSHTVVPKLARAGRSPFSSCTSWEIACDCGSFLQELRNSRSLRTVLSALLALGNHLNGGTNKGQADGFALGDLGKMSVTKDNSNTVSLLEYAVQVCGHRCRL